jgi:hypothetical protein
LPVPVEQSGVRTKKTRSPKEFRVLTNSTIVRALGTRETTLRPTEGRTIGVEQCVFLLKTEPGDVVLSKIHDLLGVVTIVGPVGGTVVVVGLSQDEDVVTTTEGISEDGSGTEVDVGVVAWGLVGGRTVEVPDTEVTNVLDLFGHSL